MGNRTRKQHNAAGKAATVEPQPATLVFPFHEVSATVLMTGIDIPGYKDVLKAVPAEFRDHRNPWCKLMESIFFYGADIRAWKWRNPALKGPQLRYLKTWLGSFEPKHEDKEAVCGWLLSLMLLEVPT